MKKNIKEVVLIALNAIIVISSAIIETLGVSKGAGDGQVGESMYGLGYFKAFTVDSNILCAIVSFAIMLFCIDIIAGGREELPG